MHLADIVVQPCGCVTMPEKAAAQLGMLPGSVLSVDLDEARETITFRVLVSAASAKIARYAACPLES